MILNSSVVAGNFYFSPLEIVLNKNHPVEVLNIANDGDADALIQLTSNDTEFAKVIVTNPPLFKVKSKTAKSVQVGFRRQNLHHAKRDYKLFIKELAPKVISKNQVYFTINFAIRVRVEN